MSDLTPEAKNAREIQSINSRSVFWREQSCRLVAFIAIPPFIRFPCVPSSLWREKFLVGDAQVTVDKDLLCANLVRRAVADVRP